MEMLIFMLQGKVVVMMLVKKTQEEKGVGKDGFVVVCF